MTTERTVTRSRLTESWPDFLNQIDEDPSRAWAGFWDFARRLFTVATPCAMKSLTTEDRADLVSKLVMRCVQDNFRILRTYEDRGKPFANWLLVVAQRMAVREARRVRAHVPIVLDHQDHSRLHEESLCDSGPSQGANLELKETATTIMECLREMNPKHRTLLIGAANGMTGRELAVLLHGALTGDDALDAQLAKNALDSLRYARRLLRRRLRDHGIDVLRVA